MQVNGRVSSNEQHQNPTNYSDNSGPTDQSTYVFSHTCAENSLPGPSHANLLNSSHNVCVTQPVVVIEPTDVSLFLSFTVTIFNLSLCYSGVLPCT